MTNLNCFRIFLSAPVWFYYQQSDWVDLESTDLLKRSCHLFIGPVIQSQPSCLMPARSFNSPREMISGLHPNTESCRDRRTVTEYLTSNSSKSNSCERGFFSKLNLVLLSEPDRTLKQCLVEVGEVIRCTCAKQMSEPTVFES